MRKLLALAVGAALALTPVLARADICLELDTGDQLRLIKVRKPRPGKMVPLQGVLVAGVESAPFHGAAYMKQNGTVQLGILVHTIVAAGKNLTLQWTSTNPNLSGTALYDNDGLYQPTGSTELSSIDCAAVPLP
jgi:hypothetical protein